jgi:FKBP-type peptidyl-prolyl cis-trans isomerase FkpA/FKBP-type peptidyl-prolyl cis-trans isomerase FklB
MKKTSLLLTTLVALIGLTTACEKKVKLDTDEKKASYAIGQNFGTNLKQQGVDLDADALTAGIHDASAGKNQMTKEEMQQAMIKLQMTAAKKQQETAEANAKIAKEFLEKNKSAEGVKVTKSGLQYIIEKEGSGKSPTSKDIVKCNYKGTLVDGKQFDSSYDRGQPAEFPLQNVIPGWTEGIQLMKVGGKMKLFVPPELAYGPNGRPGIPPNSVLVFEVELLDIVKPDAKKAQKKG